MKVLHVAQSHGGVAQYLYMILDNMNNDIENILILSNDYMEDSDKLKKYSKQVFFVDMIREIDFKSDFKAIIEIRRIIKTVDPDIIYLHSSKAGAIGRISSLLLNKIVIYNPHGWAFNMNVSKLKKRIFIVIERVLALYTNKIIAISDSEKISALQNNICKEEKIEIIFNGIDVAAYKFLLDESKLQREDLNIPVDAFVVGMVGRISKQKSPDVFIKVANEIKKIVKEAFFIIVGDGEDRKEIESLIEYYGLCDSVIITGWVDNPAEYINLFNVAMLLSRWEGFGLVLIEYMIAKKPIVASNVDAIPNIINNNVDGVLIDINDIKDVRDSVLKFKNNIQFSQDIVNNAYFKANKEFDITRVVMQHEKLFNTSLSNKK